jgi:CBS domain-containing protein
MDGTARDLMVSAPRVVSPNRRLTELERDFFAIGVSGFPVVEGGRLVGMITRSDVVRQLCVEQTNAELFSDYHQDLTGFSAPARESLGQIARRVGVRIGDLRVGDVMSRDLVTVDVDDPVDEIARTLVKRHIHRVPVVEDGRLVGIITSLDFVRVFAGELL